MEKFGLLKTVCIIFVVCVAMAVGSRAQAFHTLHSFIGTDGANPAAGLVQATDGNLYGTTLGGGVATVFKITAAGVLTTLHTFDGTDGAAPFAALVQATDGNFYGTTADGGASNNCSGGCGTVFKITAAGVLTTLYSFSGTDGAGPFAALVQATDGNFYGTTRNGGASNNCSGGCGTVFKITAAGVLTTLYSFSGTDGANPGAGLVQATDGNLYGTTLGGGAASRGTVFKITAAGVLITLHSFNFNDGYRPDAGLVQATDGNFYGITYGGGSLGLGSVFKMTTTGALTTLHSFNGQKGGFYPAGLTQASDGTFYGTNQAGGKSNCNNGCGTVYSLAIFPAVTFSPSSLSFGSQALNETSAAKTVTLTNTGGNTLDISRMNPSTNFAVSSTTCGATLAVGTKCGVSVTFTPTALGKVAGTLTFTDNAYDSPQQTVALSAAGVEPATVTPTSASYGTQTVGTTSPAMPFALTNNQTVALNNIVISTTGDFAASSTTCATSLGAKSKCTINVTFTPTATGTRKGQLSVSDDASNSPRASSLTGTGK